jgi:phosphatidylserine/phosphatidylglycerophosphate/cardiolipin synthase-like enzyme
MSGWAALQLPQGEDQTSFVPFAEGLRALELLHRDRPADQARATLVATLPGGQRGVPTTRDVVRTLLQGATREILVVGYSITDEEFRGQLIRKGVQGVRVTVVGDRTRAEAQALLREWPALATPLLALQGVEPEQGQSSVTHGKVVVADRREALIGSANFTLGGLRNNLELGLLVRGDAAEQVCTLVERLHGERWLEAVAP